MTNEYNENHLGYVRIFYRTPVVSQRFLGMRV